MLLEKSQQLIDLSNQKKTLRDNADNLRAFQSRQKQITDAVTVILPLVEALRAFRKRGIANFDINQKANALLGIIVDTEAKFQENPNWIIEKNNFKGNSFKSTIESLKTILEQQLSTAWRNYLNQHTPSTNPEILNLLSKVESFKKTVLQIRILDKEIKEIIYPKANAEFEIYERKIEQLKQLWNSLSSDEVPEAVLSFLRMAANQGAPLSLLTPEVQDWINQHGISDSLKIRLI